MAEGDVDGIHARMKAHPIASAASIGFLSGWIGLALSVMVFDHWVGGFLGAVCCGVTVAVLAEERMLTIGVLAAVADLISSVAVFVLVMALFAAGYALIVDPWWGTVFVTGYALVFGGVLAAGIASISMAAAVAVAVLSALVRRRLSDRAPDPE